jgi:hypothetical protein
MIWSTMDAVEEIYAAFPPGQYHVMIDLFDVEAMPILAGAFGRESIARLRDKDREVEFASLHRISDELAEFARTLARLAESEQKDKVSEKPVSFRPAPRDGFQNFADSSPFTDDMAEQPNLREIIKLRRLRGSFFSPTCLLTRHGTSYLISKQQRKRGSRYLYPACVSRLQCRQQRPCDGLPPWPKAACSSGVRTRRMPVAYSLSFLAKLPQNSTIILPRSPHVRRQ